MTSAFFTHEAYSDNFVRSATPFATMVYRASSLRGLAITQMILGALMFVFGVACIVAVYHWSSIVAFGIWIGIWVIITGVLGYVGARNDAAPNKCLVGCFMGFSITACVFAGTMLICYSISLAEFAERLRCTYNSYWDSDYRYSYDNCYYRYYHRATRTSARNGAGLGSCLLIFSVIEFFIALISSILCCGAVCCTSTVPTQTQAQQVMFVPAQQMYPGLQQGAVIMQPSGQVTTMQTAYSTQPQQPFLVPQQFQPAQQMQPAYIPNSGAVPAVSYAGGGTIPTYTTTQQGYKAVDMPPPYSSGSVGVTPVASENVQVHPGFQASSSN